MSWGGSDWGAVSWGSQVRDTYADIYFSDTLTLSDSVSFSVTKDVAYSGITWGAASWGSSSWGGGGAYSGGGKSIPLPIADSIALSDVLTLDIFNEGALKTVLLTILREVTGSRTVMKELAVTETVAKEATPILTLITSDPTTVSLVKELTQTLVCPE